MSEWMALNCSEEHPKGDWIVVSLKFLWTEPISKENKTVLIQLQFRLPSSSLFRKVVHVAGWVMLEVMWVMLEKCLISVATWLLSQKTHLWCHHLRHILSEIPSWANEIGHPYRTKGISERRAAPTGSRLWAADAERRHFERRELTKFWQMFDFIIHPFSNGFDSKDGQKWDDKA